MATSKKRTTSKRKTTTRKTTKRKSTSSRKTKADLEAKIAQLEKRLTSLAAGAAEKPAPKPAETAPKPAPPPPKPAETAPEPKPEPKPAETAPPKPAEKAPPAPLHERFREIPTGNWNTQKVAITGFTAPGNRYFGSRALVAETSVTSSNWNDQKTKITGFTAPGNKYFATRQRLAYHPEAKKFGTWINDAPASGQAKAAPPPPKPVEKTPEQVAKDAAAKAREDYSAEMAKKGATLPKGFIKDAKANTGH
jgi:hypothetical protein